MSDLLRDILSSRTKGDLGVEIEIEYKSGNVEPLPASNNYRAVNDGSLRNGLEITTTKAQTLPQIKTTLDEIFKYITPKVCEPSPRTSTHIHVSCLDLNSNKFINFLLLAWYFEDFISNGCLPYRQDNNFCVRLSQAEDTIFNLVDSFKAGNNLFTTRFDRNNYKYSATNLVRLFDLGTLEFRQFHFTFDKELIIKWCENLLAMRSYAEKCTNPSTLFDRISSRTFEENAKTILKDASVFGVPSDFNNNTNNIFLISKVVDTYNEDKNNWSKAKKKKTIPRG